MVERKVKKKRAHNRFVILAAIRKEWLKSAFCRSDRPATRDNEPILVYGWSSVFNAGPTIKQH